MVGVLLISHGLLCQGLADSVSMVAGNIEQSECISLKPGQDPGEFKEKVRQAVEELDTGMGVLVLTDLLGGTPFNSIARNIRQRSSPEPIWLWGSPQRFRGRRTRHSQNLRRSVNRRDMTA